MKLDYCKSNFSSTQIVNFGHYGLFAIVSEVFNIKLLKIWFIIYLNNKFCA